MVKNGDTIRVHYTGRLTDGTIFDSSDGREPLEFQVGSGMVIKGFDEGVLNMLVGDKKTITIPSADAYGDYNEAMLLEFDKSALPSDVEAQVGQVLHMSDDSGNVFPVVLAEIKENSVIIDANHQLAGKDLVFDLELVEIK